ncbi:MAG TPA: hypothetical protein VHF69_00770 [Candidatus Synoicihabitans sp.]|nr:hypothetical protein [Candidatus Synoicihabitans sp.]
MPLRIAFLCSSLNPGGDGVGDYVRCLAAACARRGHSVLAIALHDRAVAARHEETDTSGATWLRLPARSPWSQRIAATRERVAALGADVISWQFVSYGFHPKGFLEPALLELARAVRAPAQQVMLHELWIGLATGEPVKNRWMGWWQRRGLLRWLHEVQPNVLHTSNAAYVAALAEQGWRAEILPLFGNIPIQLVARYHARETVDALFPNSTSEDQMLVALTFGTLHPQWDPMPTARGWAATAKKLRRPPALLITGRTGPRSKLVQQVFADASVRTIVLGERAADEISRLLQGVDCGIVAHPWALLGKSGVATAMREHGLPILVPRDDWHLRDRVSAAVAIDPLCRRPDQLGSATEITDWLEGRRPPQPYLPAVTDAFLHALAHPPAIAPRVLP